MSNPAIVPEKLTREEAFELAKKRFGFDAVIGVNYNYSKLYHVGQLVRGVWQKRGVGDSWEEAFVDVQDFPDGRKAVTHYPVPAQR